jgi:flagellar basal body P-ring formation protein FlgA
MQRASTGRIAFAACLVACLQLLAPGRASASPAVDRVRADLERFLGERVESEAAEITLPSLSAFDYDVSRVPGELRTELSTQSPTPFRGRVSIAVALYVGDQLVKRAVVSPYVLLPESVVVAARPLARGHVVAAADLAAVSRDRATSPRDAVRDPASLVGLRLKRSIAGEQLLREGDFESVPVVDRGDRVTIVLQKGPLLIQAIGKAQETGAAGDWIRVVNLDSKRELTGRVDREGRVHVAF